MSYSSIKRKTPLRAKNVWRPVRKPIATHATLKTNHAIRKCGKVGRANSAARKEIARISEEKNLKRCEIAGPHCTETWPLAPAHRHKRAWYKGDAALLAQPDQWVAACQTCHNEIEFDAALTEATFIRLRGPEAV